MADKIQGQRSDQPSGRVALDTAYQTAQPDLPGIISGSPDSYVPNNDTSLHEHSPYFPPLFVSCYLPFSMSDIVIAVVLV